MSKVLIIIPTYNEEENIEKVVDNIVQNYSQYDYVVINDGSSDATKRICRERGYNVINLVINLGIGGAVQTGYRYARENDYDYAVQIDGDGHHDISFLEEMLCQMDKEKLDVVIGSRFVEREGFQSSYMRRLGIKFLSLLAFLFTGVKVKDITSGYRIVNRRFIQIFAEDYPFDYPEPEAIIMAAVHGGKIKEYPVIMREREYGESSITLKKSIYYMVKVSMAMFVRRLSLGFRRQK